MYTSPSNGKRRSIFKVDVHLGEHPTIDEAIKDWSEQIDHLHNIGKENKARKLQRKLDKLQELHDQEGK